MKPHSGEPVVTRGVPVTEAKAAMIMIHGRGMNSQSILEVADSLTTGEFSLLAPQAAGSTWYPYGFLSPIAKNEPGISSAFSVISGLIEKLNRNGIPASKVFLLGFSQGACIILEYAARHPQRYGGIVGLSGGLIGPAGTIQDYNGSLKGTPVFVGCNDPDPHIPLWRVHETVSALQRLGGIIDERIYPKAGHEIHADELIAIDALLQSAV